jgi:hypothetical protein
MRPKSGTTDRKGRGARMTPVVTNQAAIRDSRAQASRPVKPVNRRLRRKRLTEQSPQESELSGSARFSGAGLGSGSQRPCMDYSGDLKERQRPIHHGDRIYVREAKN